jgi:hypothetical protein
VHVVIGSSESYYALVMSYYLLVAQVAEQQQRLTEERLARETLVAAFQRQLGDVESLMQATKVTDERTDR